MTQLALYADALGVSQLNDHTGALDILLVRQGRSIDHDVGESLMDSHQLGLQRRAVIQIQTDGNVSPLSHIDHHGHDVIGMCQLAHLADAHLHDDGGMLFVCSFDDRTDHLHIDTVDSHYGIAVAAGIIQHIFHVN